MSSPLEFHKGMQPCLQLHFRLVRFVSDLRLPHLHTKFVLFQALEFAVICCRSTRKLTFLRLEDKFLFELHLLNYPWHSLWLSHTKLLGVARISETLFHSSAFARGPPVWMNFSAFFFYFFFCLYCYCSFFFFFLLDYAFFLIFFSFWKILEVLKI